MADGASITLHSSWRGIITSSLGALMVFGVGSAAVFASGLSVVTGIIAAVGLLLVLGVAVDYPLRSTFDAEGVTRRAMLRSHRLAWSDVRQLSRTRPSVASIRRLQHGGLIALVGKRRYLLVDQAESGAEHDELDAVLGERGDEIGFDEVIRPGDDVAPTWIYRSKRWRPPIS
jgi:Bacterial PH domain